MTFELLEKIILKYNIPKDVVLLDDSENDLSITDMDCVQYCADRNEICFMEGFDLRRPSHAWDDDWKILWCDAERCLAIDGEDRIEDFSDEMLDELIRVNKDFDVEMMERERRRRKGKI